MALDPTRRTFTSSAGTVVEVSVRWLQQRLNAALAPSDHPRVAEDGVWGPQTRSALESFITTVLGAPLDSTRYSAQVSPRDNTRVGMTKALESALAGASSGVGTGLLIGGAILAGIWIFTRSAGTSPGRGLRDAASERPYRVRDKLTRARYYFDSRDEAERFVQDVSTSEITGEPLHRWAHRLVVEKNT